MTHDRERTNPIMDLHRRQNPDEYGPCSSCEQVIHESAVVVVDTDDDCDGRPMCEDCLHEYYTYDETLDIYMSKE